MSEERHSAYVKLEPQEDRSIGMSGWGLFFMGLQQVFTMFGATVLVPYLTGIPVSLALLGAGLGTFLFHWITKWKVPVFLGSSFAYILPIQYVALYYYAQANGIDFSTLNVAHDYIALVQNGKITTEFLAYSTGGLVMAGLVKAGIGGLIKVIGIEKVEKLFPPVVAGSMIILIGLGLSATAINMASSNWLIAIVSLGTAIIVRLYAKGFNRLIPVIWGIVVGYIFAWILGDVNFSTVTNSAWVGLPPVYWPKFSLFAAYTIVPVAIAPAIEHFGDIYAISGVVGKPFFEDPGMHRTLMGDGFATSLGGLIGGPANTTYSENTGVLALTKVFNPVIMRIAAAIAIIMSFIPKISGLIKSIPVAVMGGIEMMLFGMIAGVGMRTLIQNKVEMDGKNLIIAAVMLVIGIGGATVHIGNSTFEGLGLAGIVGITLNLIFTFTKASDD